MVKPVLWQTLFKLSQLGAHLKAIKISTNQLAKDIGVSQQTASRRLIELEKLGQVEREISFRETKIKITGKGMEELRSVYVKLKPVVEGAQVALILEGSVFTGLGEGAYYMSRKGYIRQFVEKLGFKPYPGTLNLKLSKSDMRVKEELKAHPAIIIDGFDDGKRTFGPVRCYLASINDEIEGAVAIVMRTHHETFVLEVIAPVYLRDQLNLEDGNKVRVKVYLNLVSQVESGIPR